MSFTRRNLLAGAGAAAATTLLARTAGAQSFPFTPNQRMGRSNHLSFRARASRIPE